ncbi:lactococcin 972 family bacteriocin [Corynebacterium pseudodiphtheriticum]|uniref:lactococcin 972 family bacteriocin n=2 Tax=Corynebacterium pseudodiphtheriticum TaxID=37637 RepID=UPI000F862530|nr:lactococcin 972 family bacteriocin [Corynebacterium pseudodiphtheriticum]RUP91565.1 lactococcin 972 family bacteriocin [Corynebacterium pseudodiphtheriticum]RUP93984.1 lactococcin 972 family bacteriocin [Corynebacterium pseudodiphtheriticum]RUP98754.1 lactococcin 972 family bacteriocin [Corynebacterium pseudodiphtheriticum]RUP99417.1 lactococcin 972 family bacteriocin [Corynebacterium pseudodiphtheriticum]RUQ48886.1 lactococcin 972 family bacteriocin [Corynebacterium pseudodiphtheriticum]
MGFFRRIPKIIFTAMLTATLLPLASAQATIVHVDGGTWDYGTTSNSVWSHYHHPGVKHGSTAIGKYKADSGCVLKNQWSRASAEKGFFQTGQSYYRRC